MRNDIAKQIFDCRSGKEGVAKILNEVSLSSGTIGGETSVFAVASKWTRENPLYEALNHVKVSRILYTTQDILNQYAHADTWTKTSNIGYNQVEATYGWSDPVEVLTEGAESSGDKAEATPSADTYENWYEDDSGETTLYYQVVIASIEWGDTTTEEPDDVEGEKNDSELIDDNIGKWYIDYSGVEKALQALTLTPNPINTALFYKQLDVTQEDMDDLNDSGEYADFLEWASWELRRHVEDLVISSLLGNSEIYTGTVTYPFLKNKVSSVFTTVDTQSQTGSSDYSYVTVANVAAMCSTVMSDHKWLIVNPTDLDNLVAEMSETNPTADKYGLAGRCGVDYVYSTNLAMRGKVICLDPDEFWMREKNTIEVAYPIYDYNKTTMLYELNCGIMPHNPMCSAMMLGSTMN